MSRKRVMIVGAGITGLTIAKELSRFDLQIDVLESSFFSGGHALQFSCKATDVCVQCGSCVAETSLSTLRDRSNIRFFPSTRIQKVTRGKSLDIQLVQAPQVIDSSSCNGCGGCYEVCPEKGAVLKGFSPDNMPPYAIDSKKCLNYNGEACRLCVEICENKAIGLNQKTKLVTISSDAVILATGYQTFDPSDKPYGYNRFKDVITNFELEKMLKSQYGIMKPSSGEKPSSISFVQCVGSRDSRIGHLWCSRVCCGSALRLAGLIKHLQPETRIQIFYIDIQNFGKNFECVLSKYEESFEMIRSIPGDVFQTEDGTLKIRYFNPKTKKTDHLTSDMLVLSTAMVPGKDNSNLSKMFKVDINTHGFLNNRSQKVKKNSLPVFTAGALNGPKNIAECVSEAKSVAIKTLECLGLSCP